MTVVWICVPSYHKILPTLALNFSKNYGSFEKPYQPLESVFHQISKHLEVVKKLGCASFFRPTSVSISDETPFLVFDILLQSQFNVAQMAVCQCKEDEEVKT